jgi:DNA-binding CsgD family transcriptional regulator
MAKAPLLNPSKKVLDFIGPARKPDPFTDTHGRSAPPELKVAGRRYRLVLVEPEEGTDTPTSLVELLTPRELQIVALVAAGNVNKQVADVLCISEWTVSTHLRRIFAKLGVDTRAAMVSRCLEAIALAKTDAS